MQVGWPGPMTRDNKCGRWRWFLVSVKPCLLRIPSLRAAVLGGDCSCFHLCHAAVPYLIAPVGATDPEVPPLLEGLGPTQLAQSLLRVCT
jgi:hypothetical protein